MTDILQKVADHEAKAVAMRGFAIRGLQEDNTVTGSWAYTVGLKDFNGEDTVLYVRGAVDIHVLEDILDEVGRRMKSELINDREVINAAWYVNGETEHRLGIRMCRINIESFQAMLKKFGTPVEGNSDQAQPWWVMLSDKNDRFPTSPLYEDFFQTGLPADNVGISTEKSED